jgi:hypothetical protein
MKLGPAAASQQVSAENRGAVTPSSPRRNSSS